MRPAGHASAAIEVLRAVLELRMPAAEALRDWGRRHRFAGSHDRHAIGNIVFDALRHRASWSWRLRADTPRALVLAHLRFARGLSVEAIARLVEAAHGPGALDEAERRALAEPRPLAAAPVWVRGDFPQWLAAEMEATFGGEAAAQGAALATRAPLDIRINALKTTREKALKAMARHRPRPTPHSPWGVRFLPAKDGRLPNVEAEAAHGRGLFEIQDEGSQIAALVTGAAAGMQVLDLCAGGGGKTLALAAMMGNRGQIHAFDADARRLRPIIERLQRAGVRNTQVIEPHRRERLEDLKARMDIVLLDAPCSGSGTWRRHPDAKWRLSEGTLAKRLAAQRALLDEAAAWVRPGGRLVYVTCSLLAAENEGQVTDFLARHGDFAPRDWRAAASPLLTPPAAPEDVPWLRLTPLEHGTDGFFIAVMERRGA